MFPTGAGPSTRTPSYRDPGFLWWRQYLRLNHANAGAARFSSDKALSRESLAKTLLVVSSGR